MSSKFQITVPKKVRDRYKLGAEETLVFSDEDGRLVLRKSTDQ